MARRRNTTDVWRHTMDEMINSAMEEMLQLVGGEMDHIRADEILCEVLTKLGYISLVEAFEKIDKWYA